MFRLCTVCYFPTSILLGFQASLFQKRKKRVDLPLSPPFLLGLPIQLNFLPRALPLLAEPVGLFLLTSLSASLGYFGVNLQLHHLEAILHRIQFSIVEFPQVLGESYKLATYRKHAETFSSFTVLAGNSLDSATILHEELLETNTADDKAVTLCHSSIPSQGCGLTLILILSGMPFPFNRTGVYPQSKVRWGWCGYLYSPFTHTINFLTLPTSLYTQ